MEYPRIVLAAPGSGSGKTLVTCGLIKALKDKGLSVVSYKCGPDYIDPMFHQKVLGVESQNLDLYMASEEFVKGLFAEQEGADKKADISVIEGVMGLYDGVGGITEEASAYHLAGVLEAPVILLVDAHGMGRSLVAEIAGFLSLDRKNLIKGILLNRISGAFYESVKGILENELHISVLGYIPNMADCQLDSRYLGLKLPEEIEGLREKVSYAAKVMAETVELNKLLQIAGEAPRFTYEETPDVQRNQDGSERKRIRIAVARDEAFCFYYKANLSMLEKAGAELVYFSPLHDVKLPEQIDGLILGGGYPELKAAELSENESMRVSILSAIRSGMPSLAECGGFMYLHESIEADENGIKKEYPMVSVINGTCSKKERLVRFGYAAFTKKETEQEIKGHEFHYYDSTNNGADFTAKKPLSGRTWECMHMGSNHLWGFPHLYYPSAPWLAEWFINQCILFSDSRRAD